MRLHCSICTELYDRNSEIAALHCGHLYHTECINKWLDTKASCPSCRQKVGKKQIVQRLFLDHAYDPDTSQNEITSETTENELAEARVKLTLQNKEKRKLEINVAQLEDQIKAEQSKTVAIQQQYIEEQVRAKSLQKQINVYKSQQADVERAQLEVQTMRDYLTKLQNVATVVKGNEAEVQKILNEEYDADPSNSVKRLVTYNVTLKRELEMLHKKKKDLKQDFEKQRREKQSLQRELNMKNEQVKRLENELKFRRAMPSPATPQPISRVHTSDVITGTPTSPIPKPLRTCAADDVNRNRGDVKSNDVRNHGDVVNNRRDDPVASTLVFDDNGESIPNTKRKLDKNSKDEVTMKVRIVNCQENNAHKQKKQSDSVEINPMVMNFGIMQKKKLGTSGKLSVRTGYDGLGAQAKFIQTSAKPKQVKMSSFFNR